MVAAILQTSALSENGDMKDYSLYRLTFRVDQWTHVHARDEWLHPHHVFGMRFTLKKEVSEWLDNHNGSYYALLEDEVHYTDHIIAFSKEADAVAFLLRWT